jgi:hypothetical protein
MKQETAQQIIDQAGLDQRIIAELDISQLRKFRSGAGYRVKLTHRRLQRTLIIRDEAQWPTVQQAWRDL